MLPSLGDVLALDVCRRGRPMVVAGADRLDTPVRWVHAIELTDVARLLRGGELVLSTGIALPDDDRLLAAYIAELAGIGVAGLAVELGRRYAGSLPDALVAAARQAGLPLIAFGREVAFIEITEAVHARIIDAQLEELRASERLHEMFTELSVAGASAEEIIRQVAALAGRPVILADLSHRVLACEPAGADPGRLLSGFAARSRGISWRGRTVYDEASGWLMTPVGARGEDWGRVILVCDRPPPPADSVLIERAATTLALGRLVARHRESLERQAHRTLISGIISQAHADPAEAAVRARALGVPVDGRQLIALVLRFRNPEPGPLGISAHARAADLADAAAAACAAERIPSLVGTLDDARAGAMLSLGPRAEPDDVLARLAAQVTDRAGAVVIGVGTAVGSIRDVRRSFLEAGQVADVAAARPAGRDAAAEPPFYRLDDLRLRGLLHLLRDDPRLQTFVERELGPLLAGPSRGLIDVLAAYLAAGGNKAEAAKAANLARPTFYDRLGRIERILGTDLRSAESRTSLHVALLALAASRADAGPRGLWYEYASPAPANRRLSSRYRGRRRGQPVSRAAGTEPGPGPTGMFGADDEVGRDLDAVDWAATPLGPPGAWPQSLQTAVDILLSSRFSMWMAWGPQLTFFCNAAYRRDTLGRKYPWALGRPASDVWAEIWEDIGPRIGTVLAAGKATWDQALLLFLERSGYPEETYHTFSYSPLRDDAGIVVGMLCVVSEETERVIGERRMATLRDLGSDPSVVRTDAETLEFAGRQLYRNRQDLPFTLTYLFDDDGATARLAGSTGIAAGHAAAPPALAAADPDPVWPVATLLRGEPALVDLDRAPFTDLPAGVWSEAPAQALVAPLAQQGAAPYGFLVAALNRYRPLDEGYRGFIGLVARHLAAGIASARSYAGQQRRAEELAELDRAKTTFFSNISHEFRTPLTLIMGPVQELQRQLAGADPQVLEELAVISRNGLRLGRLVNTLLDFSRLEAGRMQASYEPADLAQVTAELASVFRSAVDRAGLAFEVDCPPLPEPVYLDRGMWEKVVLNLLSNALKFTFDGSIRIAVRAEGGQAVVTIADTGIGVPQQEIPRLFERFHRIDNARARSNEGSGIGLALVQELIQLHGGTISAASIEGEGTTFTVRLPFGHTHLPADALVPAGHAATVSATADPFVQEALRWLPAIARDGDDAVHQEMTPGRAQDPSAQTGRALDARVLVADDNADMREYLARLLRTAGYQVTAVADGQAGLDAARARLPDLVLTDVMMPRLDGLGLVAALRADPRTAPVPVVFLSARAGDEAAAAGLEAGADDYLPKPFSAVELLARVRSNLEMARFRNRESRFRRALIDSLQEGFFITDGEGTILEANQAFLALVGSDPSGLPFRWPHPWVPDPQADPEARALLDEAFASYQRDGGGQYTVPVRHRDGHAVWLACSSASLPDRDGRARLFVGTARDVTSERLAAQREATLAGFAAALAAAGEISDMLTTAARQIADALHASQATIALWSSSGSPAITSWPPEPPGRPLSPAVTGALAAARHQPAALVSRRPGDDGARLLAAPLDGTGTSAVVAGFPAARAIRAEERDLFAVLTSHLAQVLAKARDYAQARAVALTLQQAILGPTQLPHGFAVRYAPAVAPLEVGGDWYDVVPVPGQRIGVLVGDCVGRGLPAAAVMGQLRSASQAVLLRASGPAEALTDLDTFASRIPAAECTSVFCAIIDPAAATVTYSSAGHPPPILVTPGGAWSLLDQAQSLPLALLPADSRRKQATAPLPAGGTLMLYTDGLVERRNIPLDAGIKAAADLLAGGRAEHPDALADRVMSGMTPAAGFEDDVAVLIYRHPPEPLNVHVTAQDPSCLAEIRARLREWLPAAGVGAQDGTDILIAVGEASANAFEHAPADLGDGHEPVQITITVRAAGTAVEVTVTDTGTWRPPHEGPDTRGHGILFMHALMDEVAINTTEHGTTVTMTKEL